MEIGRKFTTVEDVMEETEKSNFERKPRLLLHACCAPCASYCVDYMHRHFDITVYFYNPNIMPKEEFSKRLNEFSKLLAEYPDVKLEIPTQSPSEYLNAVKGLEKCPEGGDRCSVCFALRLKAAAKASATYDYFATTLTVSPHKNAELINEIGRKSADATGTRYLDSNFKKKNGYLKSIQISERLNLYRQNYCGCKFTDGE